VVLRTFDDTLAQNIRSGFDIHHAFSTSALAAPAFAAAATRVPVDYAFTFSEKKVLLTITEFTLVDDSPLAGYTVGQLEGDFAVEVLAVDGSTVELNPGPDRVLESGCTFAVSGPLAAIREVSKLTPATREIDRYRKGLWAPRD
jgi:Trk K+ transport system NAD-binding subunit